MDDLVRTFWSWSKHPLSRFVMISSELDTWVEARSEAEWYRVEWCCWGWVEVDKLVCHWQTIVVLPKTGIGFYSLKSRNELQVSSLGTNCFWHILSAPELEPACACQLERESSRDKEHSDAGGSGSSGAWATGSIVRLLSGDLGWSFSIWSPKNEDCDGCGKSCNSIFGSSCVCLSYHCLIQGLSEILGGWRVDGNLSVGGNRRCGQ